MSFTTLDFILVSKFSTEFTPINYFFELRTHYNYYYHFRLKSFESIQLNYIYPIMNDDDDDLKNVGSASIDDVDDDVDGSDSEPEEEEEEEDETEEKTETIKKPRKIHKLSMTETENFNKKLKKRGVVYIARVPPRMTPTKIKSLLSDFGEVTRVFLVEEDASKRKRRRQEFGNSGGKRYIEGWVEFASKRKAKHVALSLNTTPISVHKRNPHCGK
jgi:ESF2/ABP1 family protein